MATLSASWAVVVRSRTFWSIAAPSTGEAPNRLAAWYSAADDLIGGGPDEFAEVVEVSGAASDHGHRTVVVAPWLASLSVSLRNAGIATRTTAMTTAPSAKIPSAM